MAKKIKSWFLWFTAKCQFPPEVFSPWCDIGRLVIAAYLGGALVCAFLGQTAIGVAIAGVTLVGIVNALANPRRGQK